MARWHVYVGRPPDLHSLRSLIALIDHSGLKSLARIIESLVIENSEQRGFSLLGVREDGDDFH